LLATETETEIIFRVSGLTKDYPLGEVVVREFRGIDLEIRSGEFVVILGRSGSGKSTLLNLLGGLDAPTSGTIHSRDQNLAVASQRQLTWYRRRTVGFVLQLYNRIPSLTAGENVAIASDICREGMCPADALATLGLAAFVVGQGVPELRNVEVGRMNDSLAQAVTGLESDEIVIVYPGDRVRPGARLSADRASHG
jgi:predicted ABC-type transport system involved in lysophospholipase L1 biosynthesis ATPase subunit